MPGLGTIVNAGAIVLGSVLGLVLKRGLPEKWQETMMSGIALCIVIIGTKMALETSNIIITIVSLALGAVLGELANIEGHVEWVGNWLGNRCARGEATAAARIAEGFVTASLLFCVGAMAVVGSIQDGLAGDHTTLFAKATLDGLISLVLAANLGVGVVLSAASVAVYQGAITLLAGVLEQFVMPVILREITASGGIMIMAIGTNMLKITKIRISNLLPGIVVAAVGAALVL